ncbi:MAG: hypothetical protein KJI72_03995 [Patescibacteria group bacterium]|nr:hypothetical protein [Patescibacteria group bacterium]
MRFRNKGLTVFFLSQFSRAAYQSTKNQGESNKDKRSKGEYDLTAFSEASEIEKAADICVSIYYDEEFKKTKEATMQLLKNRDGDTIEEPFKVIVKPERIYVGDYDRDKDNRNSAVDELLAEYLA